MINRSALAASIAVSATLVSGTFALGATTGFSAGETNAAAASTLPATPPTTSTTSPPLFNCAGSDDGLDEATKRARERYCDGEDEDD